MIELLKPHTPILFGTWTMGVITWITTATNFVGFLGAVVGLVAGVMLILTRWDDFWDCNPMRFFRGLPRKEKKPDVTE